MLDRHSVSARLCAATFASAFVLLNISSLAHAEVEQSDPPIKLAQAQTQDQGAANGTGFEEVVVTARKREEQVQSGDRDPAQAPR